ncbi:hypothetical protein PIB30_049906 [Stylosanthes scabra]|uniref:Uncharacterized protein n=1 Tax=Stylosanthes scabra TaxID=79078 RepID=A0ABU6YG44_9FABA|nr:hypothetical protein [Stylosanthes scabra]
MNEGAGGELVGEQAPNQFFRRSRQLSVAITFDPELRLMHGLRLREAFVALFASITHAIRGLKWRIEHENRDLVCLNTRWREGNRVLALSLASRPHAYLCSSNLRAYMRWEPYEWIGPEWRWDENNDDEMIELVERF